MPYPILSTINQPSELRALPLEKLEPLAKELRQYILESVSKTGGHLSSNLGTVELTVALHYVFNTPDDRIVWDVGHQTYVHKIITGRREWMSQLRMKNGPSGFPRRSESKFDAFGTAHSSTSISAALGMAEAAKIQGEKRIAIAVIGDGALSGGMAFEAMNNAGISKAKILVVLNDNEMSISPAVGALHKYLVRLLASKVYRAAWRAGENVFGAKSQLIELAHRAEEHLKGMLTPGTLFEELGFNYLGPVDGHDLPLMLGTLSSVKSLMDSSDSAPIFLHVITKKGQGYKLAENNPILYHGVSKFDSEKGLTQPAVNKPLPEQKKALPNYTDIFSNWLCDMAKADKRLVGITPAMREGSGLIKFSELYPDRYFDVGIAEQHALTFAAGIACEGMKPVVAIYSTFLQRAYDQLIHDIVLQNLPVLFAIDRAGLVGADGATHAGSFDITFLACLPNMLIMTPADEAECRLMLTTGFYHKGPAAVRYPRGKGPGNLPTDTLDTITIGKSLTIRNGKTIALLAFGSMVEVAKLVGEKINATVINMRFVKPIDKDAIMTAAKNHDYLVTLEENTIIGGAGSIVEQVLSKARVMKPILNLGLPDAFVDHGDSAQQLAECGLDVSGVTESIKAFMNKGA